MEFLLGLLLDFLGELVLGGLLEGLGELLRPKGGEIRSVLRRAQPAPGPSPLLAGLGAAAMGAAMGVASACLAPARLVRTGAEAAITWIALPLGAGLTAWAVDHLRGQGLRSRAVAFWSGVLLGLAYLAARAAARAMGA